MNIFCWPWILALPPWSSERTRGTSFLDSWPYQCKPRFSLPLDSPGAHSCKLDIFSTENYSKRWARKKMMFSSAPPFPQVYWYKINWEIFPIKILIYTKKNWFLKFGKILEKFFFAQKYHKWWDNRLLGCLGVYSLLGNYIFLRNLIWEL